MVSYLGHENKSRNVNVKKDHKNIPKGRGVDQSDNSDSTQSSSKPNLKQIIEKLRKRSASMKAEYRVKDVHSSESISSESDSDDSGSGEDESKETAEVSKEDDSDKSSDSDSDNSEVTGDSANSESTEASEKTAASSDSSRSSGLISKSTRASTQSSSSRSGSEFRSIIPPKKLKEVQKIPAEVAPVKVSTPKRASSVRVGSKDLELTKLETKSNVGSTDTRGSLTLLKLDKLKQQLESLYKKNAKLQEVNDEAAKNYTELSGKNKDLKLLLLDCKEVQQKLKAANDHLEEKLTASHMERRAINNQYEELQVQLKDTQRQLSAVEDILRQANNDKIELKKQLCLKIAFALKILHKYIQCKWAISKI
ncbi:MAG: hypothetical protein Hyperionvirus9_38 [Hyperionvirus sp.]|uniref:Uncharacterized protein n=1 Tax=Hyperionvirus sp. TaxID=2487770 RepID=A0A3G5ABG8_9VIRU|nr:MAG: hypothetical protein Hyperionvirus9_38 [Hyperionvirus sp.]